MTLSIFLLEKDFKFAGPDHLAAIVLSFLIGWLLIRYAKRTQDRHAQKKLLVYISLIPLAGLIFYTYMKWSLGIYDYKKDLPIHLCRLLAMVSPLVYYKENKFWTGVFYFWIVVGTMNAILTPEVHYAFPHWGYFAYFIMHCFLVILAIYYVVVFKIKITTKDMWNAFWMSNLILLISFPINLLLGSNYLYSRGVPEAASLLDYFGPWPWYLVTVQFIGLAFFFLAYLPFHFSKRKA